MANHLTSRRSAMTVGAAIAVTALGAVACVPEQPAGPPRTTTTTVPGATTTTTTRPTTTTTAPATTTTAAPTTTTTAPNPVRSVTNARLTFQLNNESDQVSHSGAPNYWAAGAHATGQTKYVGTAGNVTVQRLWQNQPVTVGTGNATWANRTRAADGVTTATQGNALTYGYRAVLTGGTGTVNSNTGAATIQWTGTFTVNYYGGLVPFWISNPRLVVAANGTGTLTGTLQGIGSDIDDQTQQTPIGPVNNVTLAEFTGLNGGTTGFTSTPKFLGVTAPSGLATPQIPAGLSSPAWWGSYPASYVNFMEQMGLGSFWYSSGSRDDSKPSLPVSVAYNL